MLKPIEERLKRITKLTTAPILEDIWNRESFRIKPFFLPLKVQILFQVKLFKIDNSIANILAIDNDKKRFVSWRK